MSKQTRAFEFGRFRLDAEEYMLRFDGQAVSLEPQVFKTLLSLVENSGRLCEKSWLIEQVWGDTIIEEGNLTRNISVLRKVLGDGYIQTVPKRGYRFVASVRELSGDEGLVMAERTRSSVFIEEEDISGPEESKTLYEVPANNAVGSKATRKARFQPRWLRWALSLASFSLISLGVGKVLFRSPLPLPKVSVHARLTNDGQQKMCLVTDGSRLYISEFVDNKPILVQVSTAGGETVPLAVPFPKPGLDDISASRSELIVASNDGPYPFPYWLVPVSGGSPRPLGGIRSHDVHPSPDGRSIAYFVESDLYLAKSDGSEAHKLVSVPGRNPGIAAWAPDGSRLRFTMGDPITSVYSIWEASVDGSNLHPLLPGWNDRAGQCCGRWTPDGKYFIFEAKRDGVTHLWAICEEKGFLREVSREPVQLTTGPVNFRSPVPSKDGKKIYAIGDVVRGEIMRYDARSQEWVPYQSSKSIVALNYSRDGEWVAYSTYPEATLWRSKIDGSQQQQLTFPPMEAQWSCWSPDARSIVFAGRTPGKPWKIYTVSSTGGAPQQLVSGDGSQAFPDWSPDGKRIVFGGSPFFDARDVGPSTLQILDLTTNQISAMPDSEGSFGARWSPDGRYIVTHQFDFQKLRLFDFTTGKWEELANGILHFANWSRDGKYVYFEKWGSDTAACRIRISDRKLEKIGSLKEFRRIIGAERCWSGLAQDDSLLVLRDIGSQEIYALDLDVVGNTVGVLPR